MKYQILILLALAAFLFLQQHPSRLEVYDRTYVRSKIGKISVNLFFEWAQKFGKNYNSNDESSLRQKIFYENLKYIQNYNQQNSDITLGLNQFADLTLAEFTAMNMGRNGFSQRKDIPINIFEQTGENDGKVDWRTAGAVTPVKNQGSCGSCWAFSAVGGLEGSYFIKSQKLVGFSEQQIVDCSHNGGNSGCNGGDLPPAFDYVCQYGIETETDYPYRARDQRCAYDKSKVVYTPAGYKAVTPNSPSQLELAIKQQPVPICIEADSMVFQFYSTGVLNSKSCGTDLDHCVTLVGYDDTAATPYWIVKNSWGTSWGQKGYIWIFKDMTEGSKGICGMYEEPVYPTN